MCLSQSNGHAHFTLCRARCVAGISVKVSSFILYTAISVKFLKKKYKLFLMIKLNFQVLLICIMANFSWPPTFAVAGSYPPRLKTVKHVAIDLQQEG